MKAKYLFLSLIAIVATLTSCNDKYETTTLDNLKVSCSYVSLPIGGGETTVTFTANGDWDIDTTKTAFKVPSWLTITPMKGSAGTTEVKFSAPSSVDGRNCALRFTCNGETQNINVIQGLSNPSLSTCKEAAESTIDGKTYMVKGTVTSITNTSWGNFYMSDGTGTVYCYTTYDASGKTQNFSSLGIEVGDIVTVTGSRNTKYEAELENVTVNSIEKSLIKVESVTPSDTVAVEGGDFTVNLTNKGTGVSVAIPEDAQDWLSIKSVNGNSITFHATANEAGVRSTALVFTTTSGGKTYTAKQDVIQLGAIKAVTVEEFNEVSTEDTHQYRIKGIVSRVSNASNGNFNIKDASGELVIYKATGLSTTAKAGDIVTVCGQRGVYGTTIQMINGTVEESQVVDPISVADFIALPDDATKSQFYMLTGTVSNIKSTTYGNFDLVDETGTVYVYGLVGGWGGASKQFESFGISEGDKISILAYKTTYTKGETSTIEAVGGMLFSHTPANDSARRR